MMSYMLVSNEKVIAEEWKKYAGYTVRPLPSTCAYYKELIQSNSNKDSFLIYGGTPEIRSLFQESNLKVTLTDQSELIVHAMGYLTKAAAPIAANEKLIVTNWLNLEGVADVSCDLLIGDDAINMVEWTQFDLFLSNAHRVLKRDGLFICHLLVKPEECFITNKINDVRREYEDGRIRTQYDLASRLNFICYDTNSYAMGWQNTIEQLGIDQLDQFKPSFDFVDTFGRCNSKFYCPPQDAFERLLNHYFHIEEVFYPHEHAYCQFEPVYVLRKK